MKITILGTGTWGTALAIVLANNHHDVTCYCHHQEQADELNKTRKHPHLPGSYLPSNIKMTASLKEACQNSEAVVFAVPSNQIRSVANLFKSYYTHQLLVTVAKGIEANSLLTTSEQIEDVLNINNEVVALTGPTHAEEVAVSIPTCIISACPKINNARKVQTLFHSPSFRVYTNGDRKGSEVCGAFKNIIALACGISDGLGYGDNTRAALVTRGAKELKKLGSSMGCSDSTFIGLAGFGDLIVTCTSKHSRNHNAGYLIGQGKSVKEAIQEIGMVVEGISSLDAAKELIDDYQINMPIVSAIYEICINNVSAKQVAETLLNREMKTE